MTNKQFGFLATISVKIKDIKCPHAINIRLKITSKITKMVHKMTLKDNSVNATIWFLIMMIRMEKRYNSNRSNPNVNNLNKNNLGTNGDKEQKSFH